MSPTVSWDLHYMNRGIAEGSSEDMVSVLCTETAKENDAKYALCPQCFDDG